MNINFLKKLGLYFFGIFGIFYIIFLLAPFIISPIISNYIPLINTEIKKATGLTSKIEDFKIITTPKLTIGTKVGKFELLTPDNKEIFEMENFIIKLSLIPFITKKIEIDTVQIESIDLILGVNKDGSFELEKYLPTSDDTLNSEAGDISKSMQLPFGLKLSNHLPDIKISEYNIEFLDLLTGRKYEIEGTKTEITDFIINKSIKIIANGKAKFIDREQFSYNIIINNKIMPNINLHELIFAQPEAIDKKEVNQANIKINILEILREIYNNKITANLDTNLLISPRGNNGHVKINNLSIINLPKGNIDLSFRGHKIDINSSLYTAIDEESTLKGYIKTNKNNIDLNFESQAELNNLIRILNAVAMTFNIKDLQTLRADGKIDANFNIKSNLKTITSDGYLRLPKANVYYDLYNIGINNINADIALANNNINIKNIGFSILNQPLRFYGKITQDAKSDLHLIAENLSLKGLLVALGQASLLKENPVNSGTINLKADIIGKLDQIKPTIKIDLNNIDIKNIPSNTAFKLPTCNIDIISDGKTFSGNAIAENIRIVNPVAGVSIPKITANIKEKEIEIYQTPIKIEKINFNIAGKIKNYLTEKINLDFSTSGDIKSKLTGDLNLAKQNLNLIFATTEPSTIIVPMFDKSNLTFNGNINITGSMLNPQLIGTITAPIISIPEIPVIMENLVAKLNGPILKGHATVSKFASGGIVAENCTTSFLMKGENFYLNNLKGTAFDGKFNGNIIYNMSNLNTSIDFQGSEMDAEKAVKGAIGISNALSGILSFDTNLTLKAVDYEDMIRSMKGKLTFKIQNGSFGNIGRLENLFGANNIIGNTLLKTTVSTLSNLSAVKNTAKYNYIIGNMNFSNGWANISSIKSSGETLAYYVDGKVNLINMSTNINILGRLDQSVVTLLGPIGELSADKLLSAIPKFGTLTANIVNILTENPKGEKISEIPSLANGSTNYKDFKVVFNGGIESPNSLKSFKWLTVVDTSALEPQPNMIETIKSIKTSVGDDVQGVIDSVKSQKEALKNTANELKSLFKF